MKNITLRVNLQVDSTLATQDVTLETVISVLATSSKRENINYGSADTKNSNSGIHSPAILNSHQNQVDEAIDSLELSDAEKAEFESWADGTWVPPEEEDQEN